MAPRTGEDGFTLVEMLVVLALFAMVAAASGAAFVSNRPARLVGAAADRLAADLGRARIDAIRSGRPRGLFFDSAARTWRRDGAEPVMLADGLVLDLVTAREAAGPGGKAGAPAVIAFMPDGRSTGGRIEFRMGAAHRSLDVNWLTGTVRRDAP